MIQKKDNIPVGLNELVASLGLEIQKIFLINEKKNTATVLVKKNKGDIGKYILKYFSEDTPKLEKERFRNEISFYSNNNDFKLSPKCIDIGSNYLLLEYIHSKTLRESIIYCLNRDLSKKESREFKSFLKVQLLHVIGQYNEIIEKSKENISKVDIDEATEKLIWLFANMSNSGPFYTDRTLISRIASKILFLSSKNIVRKKIYSILSHNPMLLICGFMHGDTHLDNFIFSHENDQLYLIDYAIHERDGLIIFDLVYYYSTILTLLDANKKVKKYFIQLSNGILKQNTDKKWLVDILKISMIFQEIGKTNSRFNSETTTTKIICNKVLYFLNLNKSFIQWLKKAIKK